MGLSRLAAQLTMRRFYFPQLPKISGEILSLPPEITRHLSKVLRQQQGTPFELFDGLGTVASCILEPDSQQAYVEKIEILEPPKFKIEMIQSLAKGEKLELVLQKGTELGLSRFVLTPSERSVVKIATTKKNSRIERWQKIIHEACRQCGQPFVPEIEISDNLTAALASARGDLKLMLWEEASSPLPQLLPEQRPVCISLLIGPEGGFSKTEARQAEVSGFQTVRLGPRILRTETAGLAILSILQYIYGDLVSAEGSLSSEMSGKELS